MPFVWEATKVRNLLDSLYHGYPVGYLIAWRNPTVRLKDGTHLIQPGAFRFEEWNGGISTSLPRLTPWLTRAPFWYDDKWLFRGVWPCHCWTTSIRR